MKRVLLFALVPLAAAAQTSSLTAEQIVVKARRLLQREKNAPSAVTELGQRQIQQEGTLGSTATLLRQAPSVYVYQSGPGENDPVFSIRGTRGLEVASTLDEVPMQDLLAGGNGVGNVGNWFTLDQINGVTIYPGVAYPDKNTFGTIGGTIAYTSKRPDAEPGLEISASAGSFDTYAYGFTANTGALDGPLGSGDNAPRFLLQYKNLSTRGYIDYTPARYNSLIAAFDKPYDDGLSKFQATLIYNTGGGALLSEPSPIPLLVQLGNRFGNYTSSQAYQSENNDYFTFYLHDDTYVNDWLNLGLSAFYRYANNQNENWVDPEVAYNGLPANIYPLVNVPYNFQNNSNFGIGPGYYWLPGYFVYDPARYLTPAYCPPDLIAVGTAGGSPCGLNSALTVTHNDTYGIQPRITLLLPYNTIKIGGLFAKETQPTPQSFIGGSRGVQPEPGYNQFQTEGYNGGSQRTIVQLFAQDKIDVLDNTLHITPGVTFETAFSSNRAENFFVVDNNTGLVGTVPSFKLHKYDREWLPFFHVAYDLDRVAPALAGTSLYASYGVSALFAPTTDFTPATTGGVPYASIVRMYEAGVKYDTSKLLLSFDYFYQKVSRDFGFNAGSGNTQGQNSYGNNGAREFKGLEANAIWQATPSVQLFANGSYVLAKYLATDPAYSTIGEDQYGFAFKDTPISGVPAFLATLGAQYERKNLALDQDHFLMRLSSQFTGPQYQTYDLSFFQTVPGYPPSQTQGDTVTDLSRRLRAFTVYDLLLDYTLPLHHMTAKSVDIELNLQNLFDRRYWQYYYSQIPPQNGQYLGGAYEDGLPGPPFSATLTLTAKF